MKIIGVLALQGDFERHENAFQRIGCKTIQIRKCEHLRQCSGLVIPGGESTTLTKLIKEYNMADSIREFAKNNPVMGTCAGLIMLAEKVNDPRVEPLKLIEAFVLRNGYGRQLDSFAEKLNLNLNGEQHEMKAIFIRAPKIEQISSSVEVLAECRGVPVLIKQNRVLAMSFHPELSDDTAIHRYFTTI